jgi:CheY-like chemotaxis protein
LARILVADDDPAVRTFLRLILERDGHEVLEAGDGGLAVELARLHCPNLFLCDIFMPEVDGIDAIHAFHAALPDVPIIAVSGRMDVLATARKIGAARVLTKPFKVEAVQALVQSVLG